jgi:Cysteine rich repeat
MKARVPVILVVPALALLLAGGRDGAAQSLAEQVLTGCEAEVRDHCGDVTPGEGRLLACLYAHGEKLSGQCEFALYDAAVRLERAVNALTYVASECRADIEAQCAAVQAGEGRILQCLEGAGDKLSAACTQALTDVGLKE